MVEELVNEKPCVSHLTDTIPAILVLPDDKPNASQPVRDEDEASDKQAEDDRTVLRKSENPELTDPDDEIVVRAFPFSVGILPA